MPMQTHPAPSAREAERGAKRLAPSGAGPWNILLSRVLIPLLLIALGAGWLGPAAAPAHAAPPAGSISADEVEQFMDAFFPAQLAQTHTPGAVIVVAQDGQVIFSKGYGLANVETATPMDPERTVMRVGSISKLFVATAVLQLVEQGRLDLHADVNRYLTTFQVDSTYPQPITLAHLLTHTAGVDETWDNSLDPAALPALGAYLADGKVRRVLPPGEAWYYSGVGYALAAYIVESVSGMPFDQYVAANILRPLGMGSAGYLLAPPLPAGLATGYVYHAGAYAPQPVDYYGDYPSSSMTASAGDMARFVLALLNGGCYAGACILRPETLAEMQRQQAAPHPQLDGHTYGFVEAQLNGLRTIGHSGAIRGFGSLLTLLPEKRLGFFVSFNQECYQTSACDILPALRQQFADRFFPAAPVAPPAARPSTPPAALAGSYRPLSIHLARTYQETVYKLMLLDYDVRVTADSAGLLVNGVRYVEIEPLLFQSAAGQRIAFGQDGQGKTRYLFRPTPNQKLAWHETAGFTRPMFYLWGALWIVAGLAWPARLLLSRRRGRPPATRLEHLAHALLSLMALLDVAFLASLTRLFWVSRTATTIGLALPLIAMGLAAAALAAAGVLWRRGVKGWRVYYAAMIALAGGFALLLNHWNLIGFKF